MKKILEFLIKFINDTDLEDHIEMKFEDDKEGRITLITIKSIPDEDI